MGIELEERDFFRDPFSEEELRDLLGGRSPSEFFAWKSPSFKALGRATDSFGEDELLQLMLKEPRLIRRPITVAGDRVIVGANKKALAELAG